MKCFLFYFLLDTQQFDVLPVYPGGKITSPSGSSQKWNLFHSLQPTCRDTDIFVQ